MQGFDNVVPSKQSNGLHNVEDVVNFFENYVLEISGSHALFLEKLCHFDDEFALLIRFVGVNAIEPNVDTLIKGHENGRHSRFGAI